MPKKLIINADDFGVSDDINEGIIECVKRGVVTNVSLLAVGDSFNSAVGFLKKNNISKIGLHLALTGGFKPVCSIREVSSVVDKGGIFPAKFPKLFLGLLFGRVSIEQIYLELKAQIDKVVGAGLTITHIDSHEHIHMFPAILKIVILLMNENGIKRIRFPKERVPFRDLIGDPGNALRYVALSLACGVSKTLLKTSGIEYNNDFIGQFHAHRLDKRDLYKALSTLKDGVTELACHPGYFGKNIAKTRPWYKRCEEELKVLCDEGFRNEIGRLGIELVSH